MTLDEAIEKASRELRSKSLEQIHAETAVTWAGRAYAAVRLGLESDAVDYAHEAIEHAALSGNMELLVGIRTHLNACGALP